MTVYADFRFASSEDLADLGGPVSRFNHNVAAIKLLKSLEAEGRERGDLTPDEQRTLARYSGWGDNEALSRLFPYGAHLGLPIHPELDGILTDDEREKITASALNAHYTALPINRQRLRWQKESLPPHLDSVAREIAGHQNAISTRDQNECDKFTIELRRDVSSEVAITFNDRSRAGAHLRQLCFAIERESRSRGAITKVIGLYRGFEVVARASGRQLDALSSLFSGADLFLRVDENEMSYGVNLGESDVGVLQSMDAQLRGLEGKLEKSLAEQAELEHRQRQIAAELNKGFGHAARYEELKLRLDAINQELTRAGMEIRDSPELSNLDEDAFRPVEPGFNVHQIFSLTEQTLETGGEKAAAFNDQTPIASEVPAVESERVIVVDLSPAQIEGGTDQLCAEAEVGSESKDGLFTRPEGDHSGTATATKRGAASKSAMARGSSGQMAFDWS